MNAGWNWFVIVGTIVSLVACFWLITWSSRQGAIEDDNTTGHMWDGLKELNNPLPRWWLWLFVLTLVWGLGYLVYYPGLGSFGGLSDWSQESQYEAEVAAAEARYGPLFAQYGSQSVAELLNEPEALAIGQSLYANYCSQCHGSAGYGARGFPNLTDDDWLYGSDAAAIEHSILNGRNGVMPPLGAAFASAQAIDEMVAYVGSMPDGLDTESPAHAQFQMLCSACHAADGKGMAALGAPNLTDDVWLYGGSPDAIRHSIVQGRNGVMPAHRDLLGEDRARILAAYVASLSR